MNSITPTVIGIDIGACTTKLAAVQRGSIDIITNEANFRETPTIVGYGPSERKIGELGSVKLKSNFKNTVVSPHRYLSLVPETQNSRRELMNCPCPTVVENGNILFKVDNDGKSMKLTAEQVLASFMTHLQSIIDHNNLDPKMIIISVPSYFTEIEKKAYLNAAEIAGLKNVKLVSQTVALGLDYGGFKKSEMGEGKNVVFVDFGHAQLTTSLIRFTETQMDVIVQMSNRDLGCRNIDFKVFDHIAKKFEQKTGLNIHESKRACLKLLEAIQKQRKILSGINETEIVIESLMEDEDLSETFTRDTMIEEAQEVFDSFKELLVTFLGELEKQEISFDAVELVGGGSRIPKIIEIVQQVFGMSPSRTINSSQTIARGATLAAVQESGLFRFHSFNILNRIPYALKLVGKDGDQEINYTFFETGGYVPSDISTKLHIESDKVDLIIASQDGEYSKDIRKVSIEKSENIKEVTFNFKMDENGFIELLSVKDDDENDIQFSQEYFHTLSPEQVKEFKQKEREMYLKDFRIIQFYERKNDLESFLYKQRQFLNSAQTRKYAKPEEIQTVQNQLNQIADQIADEENALALSEITKKKAEFEKEIEKFNKIINDRKAEVVMHFKDLESLKAFALDTIKQLKNRYRQSKPVVDTIKSIQSIADWAEQTLRESRTKPLSELPLVSKRDIEVQKQNVRTLVQELENPRVSYGQPRHQHYEEHYDPSYGRPRTTNNTMYTPRAQPQPQPQRQYPTRQRDRSFMDPFGMSRSGYFGNGYNPFGGFF